MTRKMSRSLAEKWNKSRPKPLSLQCRIHDIVLINVNGVERAGMIMRLPAKEAMPGCRRHGYYIEFRGLGTAEVAFPAHSPPFVYRWLSIFGGPDEAVYEGRANGAERLTAD